MGLSGLEPLTSALSESIPGVTKVAHQVLRRLDISTMCGPGPCCHRSCCLSLRGGGCANGRPRQDSKSRLSSRVSLALVGSVTAKGRELRSLRTQVRAVDRCTGRRPRAAGVDGGVRSAGGGLSVVVSAVRLSVCPARRLQLECDQPSYPVRSALWYRSNACPGSISRPQRTHGFPYAVGSSLARTCWCLVP